MRSWTERASCTTSNSAASKASGTLALDLLWLYGQASSRSPAIHVRSCRSIPICMHALQVRDIPGTEEQVEPEVALSQMYSQAPLHIKIVYKQS